LIISLFAAVERNDLYRYAGRFQDRSLKPDGYGEQLSPRAIRCTAPAALLSELIPRHISKLQEDGLLLSRMMIVTTQKSV
jgi:hypothetical protein